MGRNRTGREPYNTTIDKELISSLKILASTKRKHQNELLEEAIRDLTEKYESRS